MNGNGNEAGSEGKIIKVSGPLVVARGLPAPKMYDLVRVGTEHLMGEVIEIREANVSIQVYEETGGLGPGDPVFTTGGALSVELGPGLLESIYDGVQRPLNTIREEAGDFITRGIELPGLDRERIWEFRPEVNEGDQVRSGDVLGLVQETEVIEHRVMVPPGVEGRLTDISGGNHKITDTIAVVETDNGDRELQMMQKWPVRRGRPYNRKLPPVKPFTTGQRVLDTFFPLTMGGTACVPGPFGSGKTVIQHEIAKWSNATIIMFIGCGERGNEMTEVLLEFPELIDPYTDKPLIKRTILLANTSNMPVAAREASVYTGITMAEYYRDMGYDVALQADSTSRWAEALREISGRLEEMPGEEGYPAYLGSRVASFYERAGRVDCLGPDDREGSLTVVGSVSPPGGDLSEPVTQNTLRVVKVFWGLDDDLASARHFPAIDWLTSYSLYLDEVEKDWKDQIGPEFAELRGEAMALLQRESELEEIVRLIGVEALSAGERLALEAARSIREDFLQQNAYDEVDTYTSLRKQFLLLRLVVTFYREGEKALERGAEIQEIVDQPVREKIATAKFIPEDNIDEIEDIEEALIGAMSELGAEEKEGEEEEFDRIMAGETWKEE